MWLDPTQWMLIFARVGALLAVFPVTGAAQVPVRVRVALAALTTGLISPLLPGFPAPASSWSLIGLMAMEVGKGLTVGFACRFVFYALELAGSFIATEMGLAMSTSFSPIAGAATAVPGTLLFWLAMMILFGLDLHHWFLAAFVRSFELLPLGVGHPGSPLLMSVIERSRMVFTLALQIAAPIMGVAFVMTMVFCVMARATPQMNVFSESFAIRILAGLATLGFCSHLMAQHISNFLRHLPEDLLEICQLFTG